MSTTIEHIERFYSSQKQILDILRGTNEISLANDVENVFAKSLVIASASYFEDFITSALLLYVSKNSLVGGVIEFCKKISQRQYHTWFDWDKSNANRFLQMFGESAKNLAGRRQAEDEAFEDAIKNFMFLGSQRNLIVHRNMLAFAFSDTSDEVIGKIRSALVFVNFIADDVFELG